MQADAISPQARENLPSPGNSVMNSPRTSVTENLNITFGMMKMSSAPNSYDAEPIPAEARAEVERLLATGDLFRYTAKSDAPVTLLERDFAEMMGAKYALAVASCSAALFLSMKALGLQARRARPHPRLHLRRRAVLGGPRRMHTCPRRGGRELPHRPRRFRGQARRRRRDPDQPHARPHLGYGRDHDARRGARAPGHRGRRALAGHRLGRAQDRHDRPCGLLLVPVLQARQCRRRRDPDHRRRRPHRAGRHHVGRL